ncbi:MAG: hypothetical protein FJ272_12920 [Planctomycetes bacterium]|nr:hypothetical protein [Planctomycetota bacterium]
MTIFAFDDGRFQQCDGLRLVTGPVRKLGVALEADRASDLGAISSFASGIVRLDDGRWRMYYSCHRWKPRALGIAVAESTDGLHWTKPMLGQMRVEGADSNRMVIEGLYDGADIVQPQVLRLPDGRWRMYIWLHGQSQGLVRYIIAESADGLRWKTVGVDKPAIFHPADREVGQSGWAAGLTAASPNDKFGHLRTLDWMTAKRMRSNDATFAYYDDERRLFEMYSVWLLPNSPETRRHVPHDNAPQVLRVIQRRESEDGLTWSAPELLITPDAHDPLDIQFYYLSVHREPRWRIGFLGHYRVWEQTMDIELCFSRDGREWRRPLRGGWIPRDPIPQLGCMSAYATNNLIDAGREWLMLYTAGNTKHNHQLPPGVEKPWCGVMAAGIPKNRFAGLATAASRASQTPNRPLVQVCDSAASRSAAGSTGNPTHAQVRNSAPAACLVGSLTLRPFIPSEPEMRVDADVRGWLRAELRDPFGMPIPGYELGKSLPVHGDASDHVLRWEGGKTTAAYQFDAVSLRIEMSDAVLYAVHG